MAVVPSDMLVKLTTVVQKIYDDNNVSAKQIHKITNSFYFVCVRCIFESLVSP